MPKPRKRFCGRGHDTDLTGRYRNGSCRPCANEAARERRKGQTPKRSTRCVNGHDTAVVGRTPGGTCRICAVRTQQARQLRANANRVPALRLRRYIGNRDSAALAYALRFGRSYRTSRTYVDRIFLDSSMTIQQADEWCIVVGRSLAFLYPEVYWPDTLWEDAS